VFQFFKIIGRAILLLLFLLDHLVCCNGNARNLKHFLPSKTASKKIFVLEKFNKKIGYGAVICFVETNINLGELTFQKI